MSDPITTDVQTRCDVFDSNNYVSVKRPTVTQSLARIYIISTYSADTWPKYTHPRFHHTHTHPHIHKHTHTSILTQTHTHTYRRSYTGIQAHRVYTQKRTETWFYSNNPPAIKPPANKPPIGRGYFSYIFNGRGVIGLGLLASGLLTWGLLAWYPETYMIYSHAHTHTPTRT